MTVLQTITATAIEAKTHAHLYNTHRELKRTLSDPQGFVYQLSLSVAFENRNQFRLLTPLCDLATFCSVS